jgi:hypothetical protein
MVTLVGLADPSPLHPSRPTTVSFRALRFLNSTIGQTLQRSSHAFVSHLLTLATIWQRRDERRQRHTMPDPPGVCVLMLRATVSICYPSLHGDENPVLGFGLVIDGMLFVSELASRKAWGFSR